MTTTQLHFVVELLRHLLRQVDGAAMVVERIVELAEEDRRGGRRHFHLGDVLLVVVPEHDDLLGIRDAGAEGRLLLGDEGRLGASVGGRCLDEGLERLAVAALDEVVHRGGSVLAQRLHCLLHVEDALLGAHAEREAVAAAQGAEREVLRHLTAVAGALPLRQRPRRFGAAGHCCGEGRRGPRQLQEASSCVGHGSS
jgi:hypothetical protein